MAHVFRRGLFRAFWERLESRLLGRRDDDDDGPGPNAGATVLWPHLAV